MKKILLFGGIGLVLVLVSVAATYFMLAPKIKAAGVSAGAGTTRVVVVTAVPAYDVGPTYTMETRVVNLADPGANRYLKVQPVLSFSAQFDTQSAVTSKLKVREVVLQDILTNVLGDMTTDQLLASQGKDQLKQVLMAKFQPILADLHLTDIYFPEFVMQ